MAKTIEWPVLYLPAFGDGAFLADQARPSRGGWARLRRLTDGLHVRGEWRAGTRS